MTNFTRSALPLLALLLSAGCASVPKSAPSVAGDGFSAVRDQAHYQVRVRPGEAAWPASPVFRLPEALVLDGAHDDRITASQAELVANHAARSVCATLAPWVRWVTADDGGRIALELSRIGASSSAMATTSALLDAVVPGPFRLPAGLGGLGIATRVEDAAGTPVLEMQWARGANPLLHRARASSIGDAWELAPSNARDVRDALRLSEMARQPNDIQAANIAACEERFGRVSLVGRAASMVLPLPPEAIDPSDDVPPPTPPSPTP